MIWEPDIHRSLLNGLRSVAAAALCLVLCAVALADTTGVPPLEKCRLQGPDGRGSVPAKCGSFSVPENPEDPGGTQVDLFVAVVPALGETEGKTALAVLSGGPGQAATDFYAAYAPAFGRINRGRDILLVDQRGTGRSNRLGCFDLDMMEIAEPSMEELRKATAECLASLPGDPRYYTTSVAVKDLDRVRETLGYDTLDLYGASYGTRVALHYLRRYENHTRAVILDGVAPADVPLGPGIALDAQAALDFAFERCAADAVCNERFPDLKTGFDALRIRLESEPVDVSIPDPVTGEPDSIRFSNLELSGAVRLLSYNQDTVALLPLLLDQALRHDNLVPLAAQAAMIMRDMGEQLAYGMHNAVVCTEDVPFYVEADIDRDALANTYLGTYQVEVLQEMCGLWPAGVIDTDFKTPVESGKPVLILSGSADPVTPPANGDRAAAYLTNNTHIVMPGQGHGQLALGCMPRLMDDFLAAADLSVIDTSCLEGMRPAPFFTSFVGPEP